MRSSRRRGAWALSPQSLLAGPTGSEPTWGRGAGLLLAGLLMGLAALRHPPRLLPESMELVGVGRCMLGLSSPLFCEDYELLFWSPAYPLLTAPVASVVDPLTAGGLVSLLAFGAALVGIVAALAPRLGTGVALAAAACVGTAPMVSTYGMLVGARATAVGLLWGSLAVALTLGAGGRASKRGALAGTLAGAAALARPEYAAALPGVVLLAALAPDGALAARREAALRGLWTAAGAALLWVPWTLLLSWSEGRPTVLPRGVQKVGFALTAVIPERWARQAIGESSARQPLREAVWEGPWPTDLPASEGLDPLAGAVWLLEHVPAAAGGLLLLLAVGGAVALLGGRRLRVVGACAVAASPSLAAAVALPGRDGMMPASALLPLLVVVQVGAGVAVGGIGGGLWRRWVRPPARARSEDRRRAEALQLGALVVAAGGVGWTAPPMEWPESPDNHPSGRMAAAALAEALPPGTRVAAPFASSLVVHRAGMRWVPWPAPWEGEIWRGSEAPTWAVVGGVDDAIGAFDLSLPAGEVLEPRWAVGAGPSAVVLFERRTAPGDSGRP